MIRREAWRTDPGAYETISVTFDENFMGFMPVHFSSLLDRQTFEFWLEQTDAVDHMLAWLYEIAKGHLPATWTVHHQGGYRTFVQAEPLDGDRLDLQISDKKMPNGKTRQHFWAIVQRQHLVKHMLKTWRQYLNVGYQFNHWSLRVDLRDTDLRGIMAALRESQSKR